MYRRSYERWGEFFLSRENRTKGSANRRPALPSNWWSRAHLYFLNKKAKKSYRAVCKSPSISTSALNVEAKIVMITNTFRLAAQDFYFRIPGSSHNSCLHIMPHMQWGYTFALRFINYIKNIIFISRVSFYIRYTYHPNYRFCKKSSPLVFLTIDQLAIISTSSLAHVRLNFAGRSGCRLANIFTVIWV